MKKYLRMPAAFDCGAEWFGDAMRDDMTASDVLIDAAVHAIDSHDELVAMNKELLAAMSEISKLPSYRQDECSEMAREAIEKAKGTS